MIFYIKNSQNDISQSIEADSIEEARAEAQRRIELDGANYEVEQWRKVCDTHGSQCLKLLPPGSKRGSVSKVGYSESYGEHGSLTCEPAGDGQWASMARWRDKQTLVGYYESKSQARSAACEWIEEQMEKEEGKGMEGKQAQSDMGGVNWSRKPGDYTEVSVGVSADAGCLQGLPEFEASAVIGQYLLGEFKQEMPQYFKLHGTDGQWYLVDTQGYNYPRYMARIGGAGKQAVQKVAVDKATKDYFTAYFTAYGAQLTRDLALKKSAKRMAFTPSGRNCDKCGASLSEDDFLGAGSWSYTCPKCGFEYSHGATDLNKIHDGAKQAQVVEIPDSWVEISTTAWENDYSSGAHGAVEYNQGHISGEPGCFKATFVSPSGEMREIPCATIDEAQAFCDKENKGPANLEAKSATQKLKAMQASDAEFRVAEMAMAAGSAREKAEAIYRTIEFQDALKTACEKFPGYNDPKSEDHSNAVFDAIMKWQYQNGKISDDVVNELTSMASGGLS